MISLETFNKFQLDELIKSERFKNFSFLPITVHRALSHINNPNLQDNQTILILAYEDNQLAGYIGIMGDIIVNKDQKILVGWLSTLFVHPNFRGKKIAQQLLNKACEEYQGKILITEFTPEAESMYLKSKMFSYQTPLKGMSYHFLSNLQKILPIKNQKWNKLSSVLKLGDFKINSLIKLLYQFKRFPKRDYEITKEIDLEIEEFIKKYKKQNIFKRSFPEIRWITKFPWILRGKNPKKREYKFSDFDDNFEYIFIKVYKEKKFKTLLMLSNRNSNAKLHFVIGERNPQLCAEILYQFSLKSKISNLICFDDDINKHLESKTFLFHKQRIRNFLMHNTLLEILGNDFVFDISAGDGDAIFT